MGATLLPLLLVASCVCAEWKNARNLGMWRKKHFALPKLSECMTCMLILLQAVAEHPVMYFRMLVFIHSTFHSISTACFINNDSTRGSHMQKTSTNKEDTVVTVQPMRGLSNMLLSDDLFSSMKILTHQKRAGS